MRAVYLCSHLLLLLRLAQLEDWQPLAVAHSEFCSLMPAIVAQTSVLVAILAWNACDIAAQSIPLGTSTVPKPNCRDQVAMLVSAGAYHTCARNWSLSDRSTSGIACWGWNEFGQASPQPKLLLQNLQQAGAHLTALQVAADAFEGTCPALGTNLCYDAV